MQVICINDSNKPSQIPQNKWVKKGEKYTVIYAATMSIQVNKLGFVLKEVILDESCFPYEYFDADRFAIADIEATEEKTEEEIFTVN